MRALAFSSSGPLGGSSVCLLGPGPLPSTDAAASWRTEWTNAIEQLPGFRRVDHATFEPINDLTLLRREPLRALGLELHARSLTSGCRSPSVSGAMPD